MKGEGEKIYYCKNNPNLIFVHRVFFFFFTLLHHFVIANAIYPSLRSKTKKTIEFVLTFGPNCCSIEFEIQTIVVLSLLGRE